MRCVAAAVRDHSGATVAAMSVSAPIIRWTPQAHVEWTGLVREGAATLSARHGLPGPASIAGSPFPAGNRIETLTPLTGSSSVASTRYDISNIVRNLERRWSVTRPNCDTSAPASVGPVVRRSDRRWRVNRPAPPRHATV